MSSKVVVSTKGRVTIPKALRDRLGIRPGQLLEVSGREGRLVIEQVDDSIASELVSEGAPEEARSDPWRTA